MFDSPFFYLFIGLILQASSTMFIALAIKEFLK